MDKFEGDDKLFKATDLMAGDVDMTCNTEEFAQKMSSRGNQVYRYFYNHQSSVDPWPTWSGAKHGSELEFTFGIPLKTPKEYSANEIKFARDIITYWTNFVKNG
jgi:cholinesterase